MSKNDRLNYSLIGAAIADAILCDIRASFLALNGFPQISVDWVDEDLFQITLSFDEISSEFTLSFVEAEMASNIAKSNSGHSEGISSRVRIALSELEGAWAGSAQ